MLLWSRAGIGKDVRIHHSENGKWMGMMSRDCVSDGNIRMIDYCVRSKPFPLRYLLILRVRAYCQNVPMRNNLCTYPPGIIRICSSDQCR